MKKETMAFIEFLRKKGHRITAQRVEIAEKVFAMHRHFDANELQFLLRDKDVSRATIYRTLSLMVEAGLVKEHNFRAGGKIYEHIIGHPRHIHLVCVKCGAIHEVHSQKIEDALGKIAEGEGFKILEREVVILGLCAKCREGGVSEK